MNATKHSQSSTYTSNRIAHGLTESDVSWLADIAKRSDAADALAAVREIVEDVQSVESGKVKILAEFSYDPEDSTRKQQINAECDLINQIGEDSLGAHSGNIDRDAVRVGSWRRIIGE